MANPSIGVHAYTYTVYPDAAEDVTTPAIITQASGSLIVVGLARGRVGDPVVFTNPPTDSKGNAPYLMQGSPQYYTDWPSCANALYTRTPVVGGSAHTFTAHDCAAQETTLFACEVKDATWVQDWAVNEDLATPCVSSYVTTSGPAVLVAFCWGDGGSTEETFAATPDGGFSLLETQSVQTETIQGAMAAKYVAAAGTYNVTWTITPAQGAILWLVALQETGVLVPSIFRRRVGSA